MYVFNIYADISFFRRFCEVHVFLGKGLQPYVIDSDSNVAGLLDVKYVAGISWRPYKVTFKQGEKITFIVNKLPEYSLSDLEFRVFSFSMTKQSWREVISWHAWPLPQFIYNESAVSAIQVDVRQKHSTLTPQKIFLGNFLLQNEHYARDNFLAEIVAHHRNPETRHEVLESAVSKELKLGIYLLYWSYLNLSLDEKLDRAKQLDIGAIKGYLVNFSTPDDVNLVADLRENTITDGVVTLNVSLKSHVYLRDILEQVEDLPEPLKIATLTTYFLYNHYNYSQVTERFQRPFLGLKDINSMCNLNAVLLQHILKQFGYEVTALSFASSGTIDGVFQVVGSHAMNEMYYDGQYYVLDATTNRVGKATKESIVETKNSPEFIVFPQIFDADVMYQYVITNIGEISDVAIDRL